MLCLQEMPNIVQDGTWCVCYILVMSSLTYFQTVKMSSSRVTYNYGLYLLCKFSSQVQNVTEQTRNWVKIFVAHFSRSVSTLSIFENLNRHSKRSGWTLVAEIVIMDIRTAKRTSAHIQVKGYSSFYHKNDFKTFNQKIIYGPFVNNCLKYSWK